MIKLVIFDLGRVLIDFDFAIAIERLQGICPVNLIKVHSLFMNSPLAESWDKGLLPEADFYATLRRELNLPMEIEDFIPIWNEIFTEKKEVIDLAQSLSRKRTVMILSNTNPWHVDYIRKNFAWLEKFHGFVASCDVHLMKPDPEIYRLVLERAGVRPSEALYIDDIPEYVQSAQKLGIDALLFKNFPDLRREIESRDIP